MESTQKIVSFIFLQLTLGLFLLITTSDAMEHQRFKRLSNGHSAEIEDYPYMLALLENHKQVCGASIISKNWALTAAHCVSDADESSITLRAGSKYSDEGGYIHEAEMIIVHPKYQPITHDFALIKIKDNFKLDHPNIRKVQLAVKTPVENTTCRFSGWGLTTIFDDPPSLLQASDLRVFNHKKCHKIYRTASHNRMEFHISKFEICIQNDDENLCSGDSGSPLVTDKGIQIGVASWAINNCELSNGSPAVFSNVAAVRKWIIHTIKKYK